MDGDEGRRPVLDVRMSCETCGNEIPVRVGGPGFAARDDESIARAEKEGRPYALLARFCPFCMEEREFSLDIDRGAAMQAREVQQVQECVQQSVMLTSFIDLDPLQERAARLYRKGRLLAQQGKRDAAISSLRQAADLFDRERRFMEKGESLRALVRVLEQSPEGRVEAVAIGEQIRREFGYQ